MLAYWLLSADMHMRHGMVRVRAFVRLWHQIRLLLSSKVGPESQNSRHHEIVAIIPRWTRLSPSPSAKGGIVLS